MSQRERRTHEQESSRFNDWERDGRYVLADEDGLGNDWTLEDEAQPENWPHLIHCGNIHDK